MSESMTKLDVALLNLCAGKPLDFVTEFGELILGLLKR